MSWNEKTIERLVKLRQDGKTWDELKQHFKGFTANALRKAFYRYTRDCKNAVPAKVLVLDIETSPLLVYTWGTFDQNISLDMIVQDWSILSWSAKWLGEDTVMYQDTSTKRDVRDDKDIVRAMWNLLNEADVILTQNGKRFDIKKLNSRFLTHGFTPPSSFQHIDTLQIAKRHFSETSNKLEYLTKKYCKKFKKSGHKKFPGFSLWKECLKGNKEAWKEMQDYNQIDVLALEELYTDTLRVWDTSINFNSYTDDVDYRCSCGSTNFKKSGFHYTNQGKYQRWNCTDCGAEHHGRENLLSKEKRKTLKK